MSTQTPNYQFIKPELSDPADITAFNSNWDKLDTNLQKTYTTDRKPTPAEIGAATANHNHNSTYLGINATAKSSTKLETARTLTIGSTGKTFDGTANVSWTFEEIGAAPAVHNHSASDISAGTLDYQRLPTVPVTKGGTGKTSVTSGNFLIGNGMNTMTEKTPSQVREAISAVNKTGDTMSGTLAIDTASAPQVQLNDTTQSRSSRWEYGTNGEAILWNQTTGAVASSTSLRLKPETATTEELLQLVKRSGGTTTTYNLYGEHHKPTLSELGAAASSHNHSASNITSGTLATARLPVVPVTKGGTGLESVTSGNFLIGNGTNAMGMATPSEVRERINAVSKGGDSMSGALTISTNSPNIYLADTDSGGSTRINKNASTTADYGSYFADLDKDGKRDSLIVRRTVELPNKLALSVENDTGTYNTYYLYGDHNKPDGVKLGFSPIDNRRTDISENDDLNADKFLTIGCWRSTTVSKTETLLNCPTNTSFIMDVTSGAGFHNAVGSTSGYILQRIVTNTGAVFTRRIYATSTQRYYNGWVQTLTTDTKPTNTYNGNGSTNARTINTNGLGNLLLIQSANGTCFVTPQGAFVITNSISTTTAGVQWYSNAQIYYANGVLNIAANEIYFNGSGVTYTYHCI